MGFPAGNDNSDTFVEDMRLLNDESDSGLVPNEENELDIEETPGKPSKPKTPKTPKEGEASDEEDPEGEPEGEEEEPEGEEEPEAEPEPESAEPTRHSRPTVQAIKSKFPDFFKSFPDMRHVLFREGEYTNLFPTVEDAKEAASKVADFDNLTGLFTSGKQEDLQEFFKGVAADDPKVLTNLAGNFLPTIYNSNRDLYYQITTPIGQALVRNAHRIADQNGNDNLKNAALVLAKWAFGDFGFATGEKQSEAPRAEAKTDPQLESDRQAFYQEKYNDTLSHVKSNGESRLRAEVKKGLDPNDVFNTFTSDLITRKILEEVGSELQKDMRHMATMNSLWKQAHKAGFAGNWKDRILTTYLSRARAVMPAIRQRIRAEALKGEERKASKTSEIAGRSLERREIQGRTPSSGSGKGKSPSSGEIDWSNTSDLDLINDRPTYKKR